MAPNPRTFFDLTLDDKPLGRVVFELFADKTPRTAENFRVLCTGAAGRSAVSDLPLSYEGSGFHRVIPQFMIQGGDFTKHNGRGGESIYGGTFADEDLSAPVDREGLLVMANRGKDTNGSQFFITLAEAPHLNGKHCVFGRVVSGFEHVQAIEALPTDADDRPVQPVLIARSGQLELVRKAPAPTPAEVEGRGRSLSRSRSRSKARDDSRSRSLSRERRKGKSSRTRRSVSRSESGSSRSRSRSPPRRRSKKSRSNKKAKKGAMAAANERRDARGIPLDREETDAEIDARLEREDMERHEREKREREESLKRRLRDEEERQSQRGDAGGVRYKGRGTMRFTEDRPTPDLPSYRSSNRGAPPHLARPYGRDEPGRNGGTAAREEVSDRWQHDRASNKLDDVDGGRPAVEDRFVKARRAEADVERREMGEAGRALASRIGVSRDAPDDRAVGELDYEGERKVERAEPTELAIGGVDSVKVSDEKKEEVRALAVGDVPSAAGGGMRSWD